MKVQCENGMKFFLLFYFPFFFFFSSSPTLLYLQRARLQRGCTQRGGRLVVSVKYKSKRNLHSFSDEDSVLHHQTLSIFILYKKKTLTRVCVRASKR